MRTKNPGREAKPVHVYDETGKYVRTFESQAEFTKHYDISKPIMSQHKDELIYKIHYTEFYASNVKVGRDAIRLFVKKSNSPYIRKNEVKSNYVEKEVECYNLEGEVIATFKSVYHLRALLRESLGEIQPQKRLTSVNRSELRFVYKN